MEEPFNWRDVRGGGPARLPGPDHLGWWVAVAVVVAFGLHLVAFLALGKVRVALGFADAEERRTAPMNFDQIEVLPPEMDAIDPEPADLAPVESASLLDEIDVLRSLPEDTELEISPAVVDPEFAIKPQQPRKDGAPEAMEFDTSMTFDLASELEDLGSTADSLPPAAEGQVTIDPGEVELKDAALDAFTEDILGRGAEGGAEAGTIDGVVSLDDLVGLPEDVLVGKKTMLPSDLLFEYNSAELRESARVGLMKLGLLVERNPNLYCWIEGHTDRFGGDESNLRLSRKRAAAVEDYLVRSLRLDGEKIFTRGFGERLPIIAEGTIEAQAPNRRVEIKMRRDLPGDDVPPPLRESNPAGPRESDDPPAPRESEAVGPPAAVETPAEPEPPKAILVKPNRELPPELLEEAPKAKPVETPQARPVEEAAPRAVPIDEPVPRALPVEE